VTEPVLSTLAAAVTDGERVDWRAASARLTDATDRNVLLHLQSLSAIARTEHEGVAHPSRTLSTVLELAHLLAIVVTLAGALGEAIGWMQGQSRYAVFLVVLVSFAVAATYLDIGGRDRASRALGATYWSVASAFSLRGTEWLSHQHPASTTLLLLSALRPEAFFAAGLWQFARELPALTRFGTLDRWCDFATRISVAIGLALFIANLLPTIGPSWRITAWVDPVQRYTPRYGPWFWSILLGAAVAALITMAWRARTENTVDAVRARLFLYVIACTLGPVAIEVMAEAMFPEYQTLVQTRWRWWASWIVYPSQIALPLFTAYAVLVDNVLDVKIVVRQGVRYLLARSLVMWGALVPIALLVLFLIRHRDVALGAAIAMPGARALLWTSGAAGVLLAVRSRVLLALDRWALPGLAQPSAMLAVMTADLKQARTPLEIASVVIDAVGRTLQAPAGAYLTRDRSLVSIDARRWAPSPTVSALHTLLSNAGEPCVVDPNARHTYFRLLSIADREWIVAHEFCVLLPLIARREDDRLVGAIAVQSRRNALSFSEENLRFLRAASAAASLACGALDAEIASGAADAPGQAELAMQCSRCGTVLAWTASLPQCACSGRWELAALPKILAGRFELTRRIGAGGMGVVYEAIDVALERLVALKTLTRLSDSAAGRLSKEARMMARFTDPQIAVLYGTEVWQGTPVLVMEYLAGGTLARRLEGAPFPVAEALRVVIALASALDRIHTAGLYHGDIKPSNIAFTSDDVPKFLDFGLARAIHDRTSVHDAAHDEVDHERLIIGGTFAYLSPDVRNGAPPGPRLDVWALCLVLCEMLLGHHPCLSSTTAELTNALAAAMPSLEKIAGTTLSDFLSRVFRADPTTPMTARDLVRELVVIGS
jgi:hypothetical protein